MSFASVTGNPLVKGRKTTHTANFVRARGNLTDWSEGRCLSNPMTGNSHDACRAHSDFPSSRRDTDEPRYPKRKIIHDDGSITYKPLTSKPMNADTEPAENIDKDDAKTDMDFSKPCGSQDPKKPRAERNDIPIVHNFTRGSKREV